MDDSFDEAKIQELIPKMKPRLLFIKEREKLRFVSKLLSTNGILFALRQKEIAGSKSKASVVSNHYRGVLENVKTTLHLFAHKYFHLVGDKRGCIGCRKQEPYVS